LLLSVCRTHATPPPGPDIRVTVAADGTGDFKTVQMAVDHGLDRGPLAPQGRLIIQIRPGTYHERVKIPPDRPRLTLLGTDPSNTIITFNAGAKDVGGTFFSSTVEVEAPEFEAANITFENSYGTGTQAVAITTHSDRALFQHCRFIGWQDTLYAATGRQYFRDCYIEGHVDFIFGNAAAVFENCEIHSRGAGYVTAQSRLIPDGPTGYVFIHCKLTGENIGAKVFLGRPWRDYSRVVFIDCFLGPHIRPEGWSDWNNIGRSKTAWYGEYNSTGPGAQPSGRVKWAHQLTEAEAAQFKPDVFLRGNDNWQPEKISVN
ncbi:MAG: pectin esterase, partial [Acidobacteriaceae bacterium]|nr:pectin esterase [Acidobacteriaceae bacterium]